MRAALLLPLALLTACGGDGADQASLARIRAATDAVRKAIPQPDTAQFSQVEAYANAVCGRVNASVGMGRTGYERFIVEGGKVTLESQLPTEAAMDERWNRACIG